MHRTCKLVGMSVPVDLDRPNIDALIGLRTRRREPSLQIPPTYIGRLIELPDNIAEDAVQFAPAFAISGCALLKRSKPGCILAKGACSRTKHLTCSPSPNKEKIQLILISRASGPLIKGSLLTIR